MTIRPKKTIASVLGVLTVLVTASGACFLISRSAIATPQFGAATGQPCAACHVRPDGGTELTDFGKKFQANGNKLPKS
jgi:hypothetical protein